MKIVFLILGLLCLAYDAGLIAYAGIHASFAGFWLAAGMAFLLAFAVCQVPFLQGLYGRVPCVLKTAAGVLLVVGLVIFLAAEACVISGMVEKPGEPADYLIVLGAQVRGTRVSRSLQQRLDKAAEYLKEHEDTVVIVSGGQGPGEDISEAAAMEAYLAEAGIPRERIRKEDQSVNTAQNIRFSQELIEDPQASVAIVSNDFHIFRAVHIAKAQGMEAQGIPAPSVPGMYPNYMVREAFAVLKDLVLGNLKL